MSELYYVNVTIHVLAAMLWLGGMFFLGIVGAPALRSVEPPPLRQRLFRNWDRGSDALGGSRSRCSSRPVSSISIFAVGFTGTAYSGRALAAAEPADVPMIRR
jgi:hypothetical protein